MAWAANSAGNGSVYEDDGDSLEYLAGRYAVTAVSLHVGLGRIVASYYCPEELLEMY